MNKSLCTLAIFLVSLPLTGQTRDEQSIISVIDTFFLGIKEGDTTSIQNSIIPSGTLSSVSYKS